MTKKKIPDIIIGRLPLYLRALNRMCLEDKVVASSKELGDWVGISPAQIRKDISQFGEFGKQGTGYNIKFLSEKLKEILHVDRVWEVAIVGMGDIGRGLARYNGFLERGFQVSLAFDNNPDVIGKKISNVIVQDVSEMISAINEAEIKMAMLAVPADNAQEVADELAKTSVKAILNYATICINMPEDVRVQYIDPATHLQWMTYYL
ncbi:MAG TPA: redox-sensing transcriptional repressor Rex [Anaerolineales bacterium]|nr:redox-sensing transcriptional repressor Rex [Anaerolineales bacterium]